MSPELAYVVREFFWEASRLLTSLPQTLHTRNSYYDDYSSVMLLFVYSDL